MNKKIITFALFFFLSFSLQVHALEIPGYEGGIQNESTYQEMVFITGEPILLRGALDLRKTERNNQVTERYTYRLENSEKGAKLTRTVTLIKTWETKGDQRVETVTLSSFRETLDIQGKRYEANEKSYQWNQANLYQQKPGVGYEAGNWTGRKTYTINRNQGKVVVETQGTLVGYHQHWGTTQTQSLQHYIQYETTGEDPIRWQGTANVEVVHNRTKDYYYEANTPSQISFRGGYVITEREENILKYTFDLPRFEEGGKVAKGRNVGTQSTSLLTNPVKERLTIPAMRDIIGHWAEANIFFLASLNALYPDSTYFGPELPMNRGDFARAIAVVMGIEKKEPPAPARTRTIQVVEEPSLFVDVDKKDPNQGYIEAVYERGIMQGMGKDQFYPNQSLTKAQAVTVIIRTLGFEGLAPIQQYHTGFMDDAQIPIWAKDAIYVAHELGLVKGTEDYYFQPNKALTKAEAATLLTNLIHYLQNELRYDYRERILNY